MKVCSRMKVGWVILWLVGMGCWGLAQGPTTSRDVLRVAISEDPTTLDMTQVSLGQDRIIAHNIYNGLVRFAPGSYVDIVPDLAESFEISADGTLYTFYLRQGVQWHKGFGELTAADVKFTIDLHRSASNGSREFANYTIVERVETPDDYTVEIYLNSPTLSFLPTLAWQSGFIMSERAYTDLGSGYGSNPVGTGPFIFDTWLPGQQVTLTANQDYFDGPPYLGRVELVMIQEQLVALLALDQGEIDVVPVQQLGAYRVAQGMAGSIVLHEGASGWNHWLFINTSRTPLQDVRLRRAIALLIDQEQIANAVGGLTVVNPSVLNPIVFGWTDDLPYTTPDRELAAQLAADAGYQKGSGRSLRLIYGPAFLYENISLLVRDQLSDVFDVDVVPVDRAIFANEMGGDNWDLAVWAITRTDADQYLMPFFHSSSGRNFSKFHDAQLDDILDRIQTSVSDDERLELLHRFQELVAEEAPVVAATTMKSILAARPDVQGLIPHALPGLVDFKDVWIEGN